MTTPLTDGAEDAELLEERRAPGRKDHYLTASDLAMDRESIKRSFANHVEYTQGKDEYSVTRLDFFYAAARAVRDRLFDRWNKTQQAYYARDDKRVYYLSLEFLLGRLLDDALVNLGIREPMAEALGEFDIDLASLEEAESDAGLGNGGLGRLAACFLDSMATLGLPGVGYGIRYEYGIFRQHIVDGAQIEGADNWLRYGSPWDVARPERLYKVRFGGRVVSYADSNGQRRFEWIETDDVIAMAHDLLIPGYRNEVVNTLRLWAAKATREFDFSYFNRGNYIQAIQDKNATENISRVLYPNDMVVQGQELRLKQEYFFVSATVQDALRRHLKSHPSLETLPDKAVFQLNDTHPTILVAELMRVLVDEHGFDWETAWGITTRCLAYTNHTVLPEALETWPVELMQRVLPRHLQIIYEINARFLADVRARFVGDEGLVQRVSIIQEHPEKRVRMAHLAIVGCFSVNGVSELHTRILRENLFPDFAQIFVDKFNAKTNGITPRRWLLTSNPSLAALISSRIGDGWLRELSELARLTPLADDDNFVAEWRDVKRHNKVRLAEHLNRHGMRIDPTTLYDVQVKRIHEYKRQLLNILHVAWLYLHLKKHPDVDLPARTFFFAGKAAPGYEAAKQIVRLINDVARVVNGDPAMHGRLAAHFVPNYGVSLAERIIPAAEVSEQLSTAGTEASGTGNMKLALNGALTVGTLDGADIEIRQAVGADNMFIFGLEAAEVQALRHRGYAPREMYASDPELRAALDALSSGIFCPEDPGRFRSLVEGLLEHDPYCVLADFRSYRLCQQAVGRAYLDQPAWTRRSILNVAHMGRFSSDNVIRRYAREIWGIGDNDGSSRVRPDP